MVLNLPHQIRAALYVLIALGSPVVTYLLAKGIIGTLEMALWGGVVTAVTTLAALNVTDTSKGQR